MQDSNLDPSIVERVDVDETTLPRCDIASLHHHDPADAAVSIGDSASNQRRLNSLQSTY